jgi:23S rRNA pseudouridine1911/1915/1917 synthase
MSENRSVKIDQEESGERLDVFCTGLLEDLTRSRIKKLIDGGRILVNGLPSKAGYKLREADVIDIAVPDPVEIDLTPENIPIEILYQDDDLLVVNKPAGMVVHPAVGNYGSTLVHALLYHVKDLSGIGGKLKPGIVHRLDKDTSGLLIVAKNDRAHSGLSDMIKERKVNRLYRAIVIGDLPQDAGVLSFPIGRSGSDRKKMAVVHRGSRDAVTEYRVLQRFGRYTYAEIKLHTGRTHQIRVHFSHSGFPVLGDPEYKGRELPHEKLSKGELDLWRKLLKILPRQALHSYHLEFTHPVSRKTIEVTSDLPPDFKEALRNIRDFYL